jgi:hypothetical protein
VDLVVAGDHLTVRADQEAAIGALSFAGPHGDRADQQGDTEFPGELAEGGEARISLLGGRFLPRGAGLPVQQGGHFGSGDQLGALSGGLADQRAGRSDVVRHPGSGPHLDAGYPDLGHRTDPCFGHQPQRAQVINQPRCIRLLLLGERRSGCG